MFKLKSFKAKMIWLFISVLSLSLISIVFTLSVMTKLNKIDAHKTSMVKSQAVIKEIGNDLNMFFTVGYKVTEFHSEGLSKYLDNIKAGKGKIDSALLLLKQSDFLEGERVLGILDGLNNDLREFENLKSRIINLYKERGFKDYGIEGKLRDAVHGVQDGVDPALLSQVLTLRKHEKDFFLRKEKKYLDRFNETITKLKLEAEDPVMLSSLDVYKRHFSDIVDLEESIGFNDQEGLKGRIFENHDKLQKALDEIAEYLLLSYSEYASLSLYLTIALFVLQVMIGILISIRFANRVAASTKEIRDSVVMISNGEFPDEMIVQSEDEIGQIKESFNSFVERIKEAVDFSHALGKGDLEKEYNPDYSDDVLAMSIVELQKQLRIANQEQEKINWTNKGLAEFNAMIQNDSLELVELGDSILSFIIAYVKANQGAIYLIDDESDSKNVSLYRLSTYAYDKKKFVEDKIAIGQGLAGQCAKEGLPINLKDVPNGYLSITSGLGDATPRHIYITPLIVKGEVFGVFEIASFEEFEQYHIEFIEKLTEIIANVLSAKKMTMFTNKLLADTKEKAEIMMQQEEELKQTNEEIQATREDLERQSEELQRENSELKSKLRNYES